MGLVVEEARNRMGLPPNTPLIHLYIYKTSIFQTVNPKMKVRDIVLEPLILLTGLLEKNVLDMYQHKLSEECFKELL